MKCGSVPPVRFERLRSVVNTVPLCWQIFLAMFCSTAAVTTVYFVLDIYATNRRLQAMEKSSVAAVVPAIQAVIDEAMVRDSREHLRDLFADQPRPGSAQSMFLLDADKNRVDVRDLAAGRAPRRAPPPAYSPDSSLVLDFPVRARAECRQCHLGGRDPIGYVRVVSPHTERRKEVAAQIESHLVMLAVVMVLNGVWALAIVRRLVQAPLARIVGAMSQVAGGALDTRIDDLPPGELRTIGADFNHMTRKLEEDRRQILDLHRRQVSHMERLAAVGEVAAQLAHEVRNPLTGIGSAIQVMQREYPREHPRREVLDKILEQLTRMDRSMANFLGFARMPEAAVRPFSIQEPLERVLFLLEPRLRAQKVVLRKDVAPRLPTLNGDPGQIEEVFLNLCLNALQAMPRGGTLTLRARPERGGGLLVEVADQGCGIPPERLGDVFKPFFTTREKGSGLGLPIARQIVIAHGGEIWIESVPAQGTTVFVRLSPRAEEGEA